MSGGVCDLGDMDCDGVSGAADAADDTHAFAVALCVLLDRYYEDYGVYTTAGGDLDGLADGQFQPNNRIDFDDINDFAVPWRARVPEQITRESLRRFTPRRRTRTVVWFVVPRWCRHDDGWLSLARSIYQKSGCQPNAGAGSDGAGSIRKRESSQYRCRKADQHGNRLIGSVA